jgi:hypothetical protein
LKIFLLINVALALGFLTALVLLVYSFGGGVDDFDKLGVMLLDILGA